MKPDAELLDALDGALALARKRATDPTLTDAERAVWRDTVDELLDQRAHATDRPEETR